MTVKSAVRLAALVVLATSTAVPAKRADKTEVNVAKYEKHLSEGAAFENRGKYKKAANSFKDGAIYAPTTRQRAELTVRRADCLFNAGYDRDAVETYTTALEEYPLYVSYDHIFAQLRTIADAYMRGDKRRFLGIRSTDLKGAAEIYALILREGPASDSALTDNLTLANLQARLPDGRLSAIFTYEKIFARFDVTPDLSDGLLDYAKLLVEESRTGDGDSEQKRLALRQVELFLEKFEDHPRVPEARALKAEIRGLAADQYLYLGRFYTRQDSRRLDASRRYLETVLQEYADTDAAEPARQLLAQWFPDETVVEGVKPMEGTTVAGGPGTAGTPAKPEPPPRPPKPFRPLEKLEDLDKWLLPLEDVNQLDAGGDANE